MDQGSGEDSPEHFICWNNSSLNEASNHEKRVALKQAREECVREWWEHTTPRVAALYHFYPSV